MFLKFEINGNRSEFGEKKVFIWTSELGSFFSIERWRNPVNDGDTVVVNFFRLKRWRRMGIRAGQSDPMCQRRDKSHFRHVPECENLIDEKKTRAQLNSRLKITNWTCTWFNEKSKTRSITMNEIIWLRIEFILEISSKVDGKVSRGVNVSVDSFNLEDDWRIYRQRRSGRGKFVWPECFFSSFSTEHFPRTFFLS